MPWDKLAMFVSQKGDIPASAQNNFLRFLLMCLEDAVNRKEIAENDRYRRYFLNDFLPYTINEFTVRIWFIYEKHFRINNKCTVWKMWYLQLQSLLMCTHLFTGVRKCWLVYRCTHHFDWRDDIVYNNNYCCFINSEEYVECHWLKWITINIP